MTRRVLVALGDTGPGERALPWLRRMLGRSGATLHLLAVRPPGKTVVDGDRTVVYVDQAEDAARWEAHARLRAIGARLAEDGFEVVTEVRFGEPVATLLDVARELDVELIAMASPGRRGWRRLWTASVTRRVLRSAVVPVLIAPAPGARAA